MEKINSSKFSARVNQFTPTNLKCRKMSFYKKIFNIFLGTIVADSSNVSYNKRFLKVCGKSTEKHLCLNLFFYKVATLLKGCTSADISCQFCKDFKDTSG